MSDEDTTTDVDENDELDAIDTEESSLDSGAHLKRAAVEPTPLATVKRPPAQRSGNGEYEFEPEPGTHHRHNGRKNLIGVLVLAIVAAGAFVFWRFLRPVSVTVNGVQFSYTIGTSVDEIKSDLGISTTPGNLVSVGGNVLDEGGGDPYSVTVDGEQLDFEDGSGYRIKGDEEIQIDDGVDELEPYTSETVEIQPKLTMNGDEGAIAYVSQWGKVTKKEVRTGKTTGEVADGEIYQQGQDMVVTVTDVKPTDGRKLVALTFDDGPSEYTAQYLQILKDHGAVATFFCEGNSIAADPETAKAIVDAGCQIASHTNSHADLTALDAAGVQSELTTSFDAIKSATGVSTTIFRPPYGEFSQSTWLNTNGVASVSVRWDVDTEDWQQPGADKIVSNAELGVRPGSIILMHDGGGNRDQDLEALPKIIDQLQEEGYEFVTINDLLASDESIPDSIATGNATMPSDATWPTEDG